MFTTVLLLTAKRKRQYLCGILKYKSVTLTKVVYAVPLKIITKANVAKFLTVLCKKKIVLRAYIKFTSSRDDVIARE